jgi:hypothetical protein
VAWVLLAFAPAIGGTVPAAGAGGLIVLGGAAGAGAGAGAAAPARAGGLGMYSGPGWPQADSSVSVAKAVRAAGSANGDFTIRITV